MRKWKKYCLFKYITTCTFTWRVLLSMWYFILYWWKWNKHTLKANLLQTLCTFALSFLLFSFTILFVFLFLFKSSVMIVPSSLVSLTVSIDSLPILTSVLNFLSFEKLKIIFLVFLTFNFICFWVHFSTFSILGNRFNNVFKGHLLNVRTLDYARSCYRTGSARLRASSSASPCSWAAPASCWLQWTDTDSSFTHT